MNDTLKEQASLYVLDRLSAMDRKEFEAHMSVDDELMGLVREMEINLEEQVKSLPHQEVPSGLWDAIDREVEKQEVRAESKTVAFPLSAWTGWGVAAALFIALGISLMKPDTMTPTQEGFLLVGLHPERSASEWLQLNQQDEAEGNRFYQMASIAETLWENPGHYETTEADAAASRGFALVDPLQQSGFIGVKELPPATQGKCYLVWAVDADNKSITPVGLLPLEGDQDGMFCFDLSNLPGQDKALAQWSFFITEESIPGIPEDGSLPKQPQGRRVLGFDDI